MERMLETSANIRAYDGHDASALADLMLEWGIDLACAPEEMDTQVRMCRERAGGEVLVAPDPARPGRILGYVQLSECVHIGFPLSAEIVGLLVRAECRSRGIGKALVSAAERWAARKGIGRIMLSSQLQRQDAHRFYEREGYERWKQSQYFQKNLRDE